MKLTSLQVNSDRVVIETNGLAQRVIGGCQFVLTFCYKWFKEKNQQE